MASRSRCETGHMVRNIEAADLTKIEKLREDNVTWPSIAQALRNAGWVHITAQGLSRHFRGLCACNAVQIQVDFSFTSVTPS